MKVSIHVIRLYYKTAKRYKKLTARLKKQVKAGQFQQRSAYAQNEILLQLSKVRRALKNLHGQLKFAMATGAAVIVLHTGTTYAQSTVTQNALGAYEHQYQSPLILESEPAPAVADLDNDGDMDLVIGVTKSGGKLRYFRNEGSAEIPKFIEVTGDENPFSNFSLGASPSPSFGDVDKDGDLDLLIGKRYGSHYYYKNIGTQEAPEFQQQFGGWDSETQTGNPFNNIYFEYPSYSHTSPHLVDFDKDGDTDVMFGGIKYMSSERIFYYNNDGNQNFSLIHLSGPEHYTDRPAVTTLDFDNDGDYDILTGKYNGSLQYYENQGSSQFSQKYGSDNPFNNINYGNFASPTSVDLDNDGDFDILLGTSGKYQEGTITYLKNNGSGGFEEEEFPLKQAHDISVALAASPFFVDFDEDGDEDLAVAGKYDLSSHLAYYVNEEGEYVKQKYNPFTGLNFGPNFTPSIIDIDRDGDFDIVGGNNGFGNEPVDFYRNNNGTFAKEDFATGPFGNLNIQSGATDFIDIDGDGDVDFFIAPYDGTGVVRFFENIGGFTSIEFIERTGVDNPLSGVALSMNLYPRFKDIDHDGDLDALIGVGGAISQGGNKLLFFENTGTYLDPVFEPGESFIELAGEESQPSPAFTDQDGDGDLDIFIGESNGNVTNYININEIATVIVNETTLTVDEKELLDEDLTITDHDSDFIVYAFVRLKEFTQGDAKLTATAQPGITVGFNPNRGELVLFGKATIQSYETVLRSVHVEYFRPVEDPIAEFIVYDQDYTNPHVFTRDLNIVYAGTKITSTEITSVNERDVYSYTITAKAGNSTHVLTYSAPVLPAWLSFDPETQILSGTPTNNEVGVHDVTLRVNDGEKDIDQVFTITVVNVNDAPVVSLNQIFSISEETTDGTTVGTVTATDVDGSTFTNWSIESGNINGVFAINSNTGEITVNNASLIDFNTKNTYTLSIMVSDGIANSAMQDVIVNVISASAPPVITANQSFNIIENSSTETTVGTVVATDPNGTTSFSSWTIISGNDNNVFTIDAETGVLKVADASTLDFESGTSFTLTLTVSDGANTSAQETIMINVTNDNDVAPVITTNVFSVTETSEPGTVVGTISATDADGETTFTDWSIISGNINNAFSINTLTGEITVQNVLDHATAEQYTLALTVSDGTNTSATQTITINITSVNEHAPVIISSEFTIAESTPNGSLVGTLTATDEDSKVTPFTWAIVAGNTDDAFEINAGTGMITVKNSTALDYEMMSVFSLTISVNDGVHTTEGNVIINISDVFDNMESNPVLYTAFSPNGDGVNDTWNIPNLEHYPNSVVKIFNSDGIELFSNKGYTQQWDGKHKGKVMALGTYYYLIRLNDASNTIYKGHLMIIK